MNRRLKLALFVLSFLCPVNAFSQTIKVQLTEDVTTRAGGPVFFHATVAEEASFSVHFFHVGSDAIVTVRHPEKGLPYLALATVVAGGENVEFADSALEPVTILNALGYVPSKAEEAEAMSMFRTGSDFTFPTGLKLQFGNLQMDYGKYLKLKGQPVARTPEQWMAVKQAVAEGRVATFKPSGPDDQTYPTMEAAIAKARATTDPNAEICGPQPGIGRTCMNRASWLMFDHEQKPQSQQVTGTSGSSLREMEVANQSGTPDPQDPRGFEVLGVKLYMSGAEALEALKEHTHAKVGEGIDVTAHVGNGEETTTAGIVFKGVTSTLKLTFTPTLPGDTSGKREVLTLIDFLSTAKTVGDIKQFQTSVKEKYGSPRYQIPLLHMPKDEFANVADEWCPPAGEPVPNYRQPVVYPYMEMYEFAGTNTLSGSEFRIVGSPKFRKAYDAYLAQRQSQAAEQAKVIAAQPTMARPDFDTAVAAPPPPPPSAPKPAEVAKPVPRTMENATLVFVRLDEPMYSHGGKPVRTYRATVVSARASTGILSSEPLQVPAGTKAELSIILESLLGASDLIVQLEGLIANGKHYERKSGFNVCGWRSATGSHLRDSDIRSHYGGGLELDSTLSVPAGTYFLCTVSP